MNKVEQILSELITQLKQEQDHLLAYSEELRDRGRPHASILYWSGQIDGLKWARATVERVRREYYDSIQQKLPL